jgi:hypothetical protein
MTKQIGRNPAAINAIRAGGIDACVAVDMDCARAIHSAHSTVGHLGHLVQVPRSEAQEAAVIAALYWTVFSQQKAEEAGAAVRGLGGRVRLLARIHAPGDAFYPGHEGGFEAEDILAAAERLQSIDGGTFAGVTTFPALLYDAVAATVRPTPNLGTLTRGREATGRWVFGCRGERSGHHVGQRLALPRRRGRHAGRAGSRAHRHDPVACARRPPGTAGDAVPNRGLACLRRSELLIRRWPLHRSGIQSVLAEGVGRFSP